MMPLSRCAGGDGKRWRRHSERIFTSARASGKNSYIAEKEAYKRLWHSSIRQRPHHAGDFI